MVSHQATNPPVSGLTCAEQTGCGILLILWSYVLVLDAKMFLMLCGLTAGWMQ